MKSFLSLSARILLIRLFLLVLSAGILYGIWDNMEFLERFPFYFLAVIDLAFAGTFVYIAYSFAILRKTKSKLILYSILAFWIYSTVVSLSSSALHAYNLGLSNVAQAMDTSVSMYIATEILYLAILPSAVFVYVLWLVKKS